MGGKDEDLETFRIADKRRPEVRSFQRTVAQTEPEPSPSVGFPTIERHLEEGSIDDLAETLRPAYERLEGLVGGNDPKVKGAAKKAMIAYERCADLMEYLFATKEALKARTGSE